MTVVESALTIPDVNQAKEQDLALDPDPSNENACCWKVLLVDDQAMTHVLVKRFLKRLVFKEKPLEFISAHSAAEAMRLVEAHPDTALIFLDMVMEEDDSGLKVANYVRHVLGNKLVRIILQTGLDDQLSVEEIIREYDINAYLPKTQLKPQELIMLAMVSLRSYHDLNTIEANYIQLTELSDRLQKRKAELQTANEQLEHEIAERKQIMADREKLLVAEREQRLMAESLAETTMAFATQPNQEAVLNEALRQMKRLVSYRTAHIMLLENDALHIAGWRGYRDVEGRAFISNLVQSLAEFPIDAEAVRSRQPVIIPDTRKDPRWVVVEPTAWVMSYASVPICHGDRVLGLLRLDADTPEALSNEKIARLQPLANAAGLALENARLFDQAQQEIVERKRAAEKLEKVLAQNEQLLTSISSILIGVGQDGQVTHWNMPAENTFGISASQVVGLYLRECNIQWNWEVVEEGILECLYHGKPVQLRDINYTRPNGQEGFLNLNINLYGDVFSNGLGVLLLGEDTTELRILESQLAQAQKLEAVGQLAAGIAHEINTPTQYIGDNVNFLQNGLEKLSQMIEKYDGLLTAFQADGDVSDRVSQIEAMKEQVRLDYLLEEMPFAVHDAIEGIERVTKIVHAMKVFSHPGVDEKTTIDINEAIRSTITVARNEWKYVAEIETDFDEALPQVLCLPGEFNQVILNMLVNAAHAIQDVIKDSLAEKGKITITTRLDGDWAEIRIRDSGTGIPESIRSKVFDPFFTTKDVGRGTGQGLAISHSVIVEKHGGTVSFETEQNKGTTFIIRLPLRPEEQPHEVVCG